MTCSKCGAQLSPGAKWCASCGTPVAQQSSTTTEPVKEAQSSLGVASAAVSAESSKLATIKCGNCGYVGPGEKNRSLIAKILAWLCVVFAPLITILYFVATRPWRCPKCKSTFVGIRNKEGTFVGQEQGAWRWVLIILISLVAIAVIGILASVVLVSLNSARTKGADTVVQANLSSTRTLAELHWTEEFGYAGVCQDTEVKSALEAAEAAGPEGNLYECNDTKEGWAAASALRSGGYWCVDGTGASVGIDAPLGSGTLCGTSSSLQSEQDNTLSATPAPQTMALSTGTYTLTGYGASQSSYTGTVTIKKRPETERTYDLTWSVASGQMQIGVGILSGDILSVSYYELQADESIRDIGVVSYRVVDSSHLEGEWASVQGGAIGKEYLSL